MLPAFTVSCVYQRESDSVQSEVPDLCDVLSELRRWSEDAELGWAPRFSDPEIRAEQEALIARLMREQRLLARLRRWIRNEPDPSGDIIGRQLELVGRAGVAVGDFESIEEFAAAAMKALDRNKHENFYAMRRKAGNSLAIAVWKKSWRRYWCSLHLYRFDDKALVLQVKLLSTEAYDSRELQEVGEELLTRLEDNGRFFRWR